MKLCTILLFCFLLPASHPIWLTDFKQARSEAKESNKAVLLSFSGSDWCIPCIRMHKAIFEDSAFEAFAGSELVLVNADFPRLSKHRLSKDRQAQNDKLAEVYNRAGAFPFTVLLNSDGKVLKSWEGCPNESGAQFAAEIKTAIHHDQ
jgi:thioredoxin-related protein